MWTRRWAFLVTTLLLGASCALLTRSYRPPHAPASEAAKLKFPWGWPKERVTLNGVWLRAVTMAMDDFLPEEEAERAKGQGPEAACMSRRDSYDVEAWVWPGPGAGDAGAGEPMDAGSGSVPEMDAGHDYELTQPGMPKAPPVIFVTIFLLPDACDFGESPPVDVGATYAIDTVNWRVLAIQH